MEHGAWTSSSNNCTISFNYWLALWYTIDVAHYPLTMKAFSVKSAESFFFFPSLLAAKKGKKLIVLSQTAQVAFVAIGATMVGSITFTKKKGDYVQKGDEFGYFSFGGSTVICLFEKDAIDIDEDLLMNSARPLETLVSVGMTLGVSTKKHAEIGLPSLEKCDLQA
ncbi:phosphatidylserine decarboxylase [Sarracenia purpurea var. burkii]